jgi:hypothetical protein
MNDATARSLPTMTGFTTPRPVSVLFGTAGVPVAGNFAYLLPAAQMGAKPYFDSYTGLLQTDYEPSATYANIGEPFGFVLHPQGAVSGNLTGATVDTASAASNGWHAALHVTTAGGTHTMIIEDSADGDTWGTLGTFTINGSAKTAEAIGGAGAVERYVRFASTDTGSCTAVCTFSRWTYAEIP